jgi:hypothetical protein
MMMMITSTPMMVPITPPCEPLQDLRTSPQPDLPGGRRRPLRGRPRQPGILRGRYQGRRRLSTHPYGCNGSSGARVAPTEALVGNAEARGIGQRHRGQPTPTTGRPGTCGPENSDLRDECPRLLRKGPDAAEESLHLRRAPARRRGWSRGASAPLPDCGDPGHSHPLDGVFIPLIRAGRSRRAPPLRASRLRRSGLSP